MINYHKYVLLGSGGLDSTVAGAIYHRDGQLGAVLFASYGQPACSYERTCSKGWAETWGVPWFEVDINLMGVQDMRAGIGAPGPRIVPARNLALISHAANAALTLGLQGVIIGTSGADHADYADCRPMFLRAAGAALGQLGLELMTPLAFQTRRQVREYANEVGLDISLTWSCYTPKMGAPCGTCNSCLQGA